MSEVVHAQKGALLDVSDASLEALTAWVSDPNTRVEDIAWNAAEFQAIRDWLKAHAAAQALRLKAIRAELIALRRVGQAGLIPKLSGSSQLKPTAKWLAELTEDGFASLLDEVTEEQTPIMLWRSAKREGEGLQTWLEREDELSGNRHYSIPQTYRSRFSGVADAARQILDEIQLEGTSFTVQEAADRLAIALEQEGVHVHQALRSTPLTQLIRNAIHRGSEGYERLVDRSGATCRVPAFVTYETREGVIRVPWQSASLAQMKAFVEMQEEKARVLTKRAEEYRALLGALVNVASDDSEPCVSALASAKRRRQLTAPRDDEGGVAA